MAASDDYDPHMYREVLHPLTNMDALVSLLKSVIGTGILAMPMGFFHTGWLNGFISTAVISIILTYALHILMQGMYTVCKWQRVPQLTLPESLTIAFQEGPPCLQCLSGAAAFFADFFLAFYQFGSCSVYVVFVSDNVKQVVDYYLIEMDNRVYMVLLIAPLILTMIVRNLKSLVPFAAAATLLMAFGLGIVLYYVVQGLPPLIERRAFQDLRLYPLFFGTSLFALTSFGMMLAIEANMKTPKDYLGFTGVMNCGMLMITIIYCLVGFLGYWRYGDETKGSITLNIPERDILPQTVKVMFAIAIFFSFPLQAYVPIDIVCNHYLLKKYEEEKHQMIELITRVLLVFLCVAAAIAVPHLGLFLSLVGSLFAATLSLIIPALMDICVKYRSGYGLLKIYLIQDILLLLFGVLGTIAGTWVALNEIYAAYGK